MLDAFASLRTILTIILEYLAQAYNKPQIDHRNIFSTTLGSSLSITSWGCAEFIEIIFLKNVCLHLTYLPMFVCPYAPTHKSKFFTMVNTPCISAYILASCTSKLGGFFPRWKTRCGKWPQTGFPCGLFWHYTTENTEVGLSGSQEMRILSFGKWAWPIFMQTQIKSTLEALLKKIQRITR